MRWIKFDSQLWNLELIGRIRSYYNNGSDCIEIWYRFHDAPAITLKGFSPFILQFLFLEIEKELKGNNTIIDIDVLVTLAKNQ